MQVGGAWVEGGRGPLCFRITAADMADSDLRCGFLASYHSLTLKLDTEALLPHLISSGLITPDEKEEIVNGAATGSQKTDRLLMIVHRRGKGDPTVFSRLYDLLSDRSVNSGQLLDGVLEQIRRDACDPEVKVRFSRAPQRKSVSSMLSSVESSVAESLTVDEFLPQFISGGILTTEENEVIR